MSHFGEDLGCMMGLEAVLIEFLKCYVQDVSLLAHCLYKGSHGRVGG